MILGVTLGCSAGYVLGQALRNRWLPQFLQNAGTLTFMLGCFAFSNFLVHESGLLTVTIMGIWLANMKGVPVEEILEFKESLSVLLISALFILLAARMDLNAITVLGWGPIWVIIILMLVARPLAVWIAAIGTDLSWQEKTFLGWVAPRGIVAAAVAALFAFKLEEKGCELKIVNYLEVGLGESEIMMLSTFLGEIRGFMRQKDELYKELKIDDLEVSLIHSIKPPSTV